MYQWKCDKCEFSVSASQKSYSRDAMKHVKQMKADSGEKHSIYLADENGNTVTDDQGKAVKEPNKAGRLGYMDYKPRRSTKKSDGNGDAGSGNVQSSGAQKGRIQPEMVDLDSRIRFLYEWDVFITGYEGSFSQWIFDTILGFHIQNKEALRFDMLFQQMSSKSEEMKV